MSRRLPGGLLSLLIRFWLVVLVLAGLPGDGFARSTEPPAQGRNPDGAPVVELLRVSVPADARQAWRQAEQETWEPWLQRKDGFLGRELLWDAEREEGVLLIHWHSRHQWLAIPEREIAAVQGRFEAAARRALATDSGSGSAGGANPFPLVFAGELEPMGATRSRVPSAREMP
ncbi:TIGR03792 family protein [Synechococcus sp. CCY 9618]|uniref:TIGR03792 family protein n=1 Tax=Synechococcus sp. CCY 9618 TaxID=2815602 RepID=UPI001C249E69|nr:TIGR03792 family protein [Synechococcus sp. CCY 9618]